MRPSSHRVRQSGAASSSASTRLLPAYEKPAAPLNAKALHALQSLPTKNDLGKLKQHLKDANEKLGEVVDDINETTTQQGEVLKRRRARRAEMALGTEGEPLEGEEQLEQLTSRVEAMTAEIEAKVRSVIDSQARVEASDKALREVSSNVTNNQGRTIVAATQSTLGASQFKSRRSEDREEEEDDVEDSGFGVPALLKRKAEDHEREYNALSMKSRYANHNDYISFKKTLHYALHGHSENIPLVPHSNTWFRSDSDAAEGSEPSGSLPRGEADMGDDSDIEIEAENINIKCPITLLVMKEPVTSRKCPHSFEKDAIEDMIRHCSLQIGGSGSGRRNDGTPALKCPVCSLPLTMADLAPDPVLRRNIQRIQAAETARNNIDDDEDDDGIAAASRSLEKRAQSVRSSYAPRQSLAPQIKSERATALARGSMVPNSQLGRATGTTSNSRPDREGEDEDEPPRSTAQVVDLGVDPSSDDEEDGT